MGILPNLLMLEWSYFNEN